MKYAKALVAILVAGAAALVGYLSDNVVTPEEWVNVAIAGTTAAGILAAPNIPGARYTKTVLAVLGAVLAALVSMISDGLSNAELLQLLVVAAGAVGVYAVPNSGVADPAPDAARI